MKKTIKYSTAMLALLLGTTIMSNTAFAADGASVKSIGTISYVPDDSTVTPIDPIDPDPEKPIVPTDPGDHENPTAGPLSIDYVSNLRFGEQKTTGQNATYYANLDKIIESDGSQIERPNFVQVTDKRGSNAGWHLTVTEDAQFKSGENELTGAQLTLMNGTMATPNDGIEPTAEQKIALTPGTASDVLDAKADQGTGTWLDRFGTDEAAGKKSVSLSVPGKTKKVQSEYKTSLTWTLTDTPA